MVNLYSRLRFYHTPFDIITAINLENLVSVEQSLFFVDLIVTMLVNKLTAFTRTEV